MKILVTGSKKYQNKYKIKEFIFGLKEKNTTDDLIVASRGDKNGVDDFVKKAVLSLDMTYGEFLPYHENRSQYCIMPAFRFGENYSPQYYFWRDNDAVKWAEMIVIFVSSSDTKSVENIIKAAKNSKKKHFIIID